jgi:hypothetical protein
MESVYTLSRNCQGCQTFECDLLRKIPAAKEVESTHATASISVRALGSSVQSQIRMRQSQRGLRHPSRQAASADSALLGPLKA